MIPVWRHALAILSLLVGAASALILLVDVRRHPQRMSEWLAFFLPTTALWFGYQSIFSNKIFAVWVIDFILAFVFGIGFQYLTIAPMRGLGFRDGIVAA